ncbi:MAG: tetratricopeptide repeat protein [Phycisphaerales bacterium]|nr:tetratricopeptide repeat protein [Phycisphaerales bacterium]
MNTGGDRVRDIFLEAAALPEARRAEFLRERCAGDEALAEEVRSLLSFHEHDTGFLSGSPLEDAGLDVAAVVPEQAVGTLEPGAEVAGFTIVRLLGAGGMGVVYEATQESPKRSVALKLMRPGFVSRAMLRRFEQEAQALAMLRHPGIAQVYGAGMDRRGASLAPYLAMELVEGESLMAYTARAGAGLRQRLELFARLCDAVSHAHQRGVVHRDLKPANILIDASGQPKVLDFGIARLTGDDAVTATVSTQTGQILGTLSYISPEQLSGDPRAVDVRADVYALGVILYELLSGRLPLDLSKSSLHEASRIIQESEPPGLGTINAALRGDLETITRKAMEKDPARRYQSAAELAEDLRRHLRHEPILARPPSALYRARKFSRRHRPLVAGAAAVMLTLVAGLAATLNQARRAEHQAQEAEAQKAIAQQQARAAEEQRRKAESETLVANNAVQNTQQLNKFFQEMFYSIDPSRAQGREVTVREVLDRAAERIDSGEELRPFVRITLRQTVGNVYLTLGEEARAEANLRDAVKTYQTLGVGDRRDAIDTQRMLANAIAEQSRYAEAEPIMRDALERALRSSGPDDIITASTRSDLAIILEALGRYDEAEPLYRADVETSRRLKGDGSVATIQALGNFSMFLLDRGRIEPARLEESETFARQAEEMSRRSLGNRHPTTITSIANLAAVLDARGKVESAAALYRESIELGDQVLGPQHPDTFLQRINLGLLLALNGRAGDAETLLVPMLEQCRAQLGDGALETRKAAEALARLRQVQGRLQEAAELARLAYDSSLAAHGATHDDTRQLARLLATLLEGLGRGPEAGEWRAKG